MSPDDLCECGHERAWHDACSKCDCPWFLTAGETGPLKRWRRDRKARAAAERREGD